jgi:hypothetical protein
MIPVYLNVDKELKTPLILREYYEKNNIKVYGRERGETNKNALIEKIPLFVGQILNEVQIRAQQK